MKVVSSECRQKAIRQQLRGRCQVDIRGSVCRVRAVWSFCDWSVRAVGRIDRYIAIMYVEVTDEF
jgi:hypothetical protein